VRIPTVAATVRTYLLRGLLGDPARWRTPVLGLTFLGLMVMGAPRMDAQSSPPLLAFLILCGVVAASDARREYLFGGPQRLVVAAGVTTFVSMSALLGLVYAASIMFGPEPGSAPSDAFFSLQTNVVVGVFLAIAVLVAILYWIRRPVRERQDAEFRALVRAERAARGKPVRA
jgi:hypothetical protein